jgi:hypothetical protein
VSELLDDAIEYLKNRGWSEPAAQGIVAHLDFETPDNVAHLKGDRWQLYKDWASAHERRADYLSSQLAFVSEDLLGAFHIVGRDIASADTAEEAVRAAAPYFGREVVNAEG